MRIAPDAAGCHWSRELGIGFVWQSGARLVRVVTATGEWVPTAREETARRREAEAAVREEARQRAEAEARAAEETLRRAEAERRAAGAEARAEALAAEVARLLRGGLRVAARPPCL